MEKPHHQLGLFPWYIDCTGTTLLQLTLDDLDCQMPVLESYETTARIRADNNGKQHVPIIAMTANAMQGDAEKCFTARMDDYLSKPVDVHILREKLELWLRQDPPAECGLKTTA